jgi:hypothetical protein
MNQERIRTMSAEAITIPLENERHESRLPFDGEFEFTCDGQSGAARWCSMSHQGACISIGRYLRPTRLIRIEKDGHEIFGSVVWCQPTTNSESFVAGIRFIDGSVEASFIVLSAMVQQMVRGRKQSQLSR